MRFRLYVDILYYTDPVFALFLEKFSKKMKTTNHNGWLLMNCIQSLQLELTTNITGDCCYL